MKKLLLVDDHQIVLDGLKKILEDEPEFEIAGQAHNGKEALALLPKLDVNIICADIEMPVLDGLELARAVKEKYPHLKILILSMYSRPELIRQLSTLGVEGFVKKDAGKMELLLALEHLSNGDTYYSQHFTKSLIESQKTVSDVVQLTSREKEVLNLLSEGLNTFGIAEKLFISHHTVQTHRKKLLSKLMVNNTTSLVKKAVGMGLISMS